MVDLFRIHGYVQGSAYLKRDDGSTLTLPVVWLPEHAKKGDELVVNIDITGGESFIRVELAEPDRVEKALDLEG